MTSFTIDERMRLAIELALTAGSHDPSVHERQDADAKRLGMSGADIDAARRGWSFDVRTSLALALAVSSGSDTKHWRTQRTKALRAGIAENVCREIEAFSLSFRSSRGRNDVPRS